MLLTTIKNKRTREYLSEVSKLLGDRYLNGDYLELIYKSILYLNIGKPICMDIQNGDYIFSIDKTK